MFFILLIELERKKTVTNNIKRKMSKPKKSNEIDLSFNDFLRFLY